MYHHGKKAGGSVSLDFVCVDIYVHLLTEFCGESKQIFFFFCTGCCLLGLCPMSKLILSNIFMKQSQK